MKKILISSGSSFIAKNIREQLKYNFTAPLHLGLDLLDPKAVNKFFKNKYFDVVIHTAGVGGRGNKTDGEDVFYQNVCMFENIIQNEEHFGKLINMGSGAEYGKQLPIVNVKETFERIPTDFYGMAKQVIGMVIERTKKDMVNLRTMAAWGKYEKPDRFISTILSDPEELYIHDCLFNYCYVDDLVKIIDWFINNDSEYRTYNIGGTKIRLTDIAKKLKKPYILGDPGNEYTCDDTRLREELKFKFSNFDKCLKKYQSQFLVQA